MTELGHGDDRAGPRGRVTDQPLHPVTRGDLLETLTKMGEGRRASPILTEANPKEEQAACSISILLVILNETAVRFSRRKKNGKNLHAVVFRFPRAKLTYLRGQR